MNLLQVTFDYYNSSQEIVLMNPTPNTRTSPLVMIADNDAEERCLLKAFLKLRGFQVVEAADGQRAIDLATEASPDLLFVDLRLPRISGPVVIRQISNQARLRNQQVVTVSLSCPGRKHSRVAGSAAHLEKPVEFDELTLLIDRLLPGRGLQAEA